MFSSTFLPLWLATGLYLWQGLNLIMNDDIPGGGVFLGYSLANVFLIASFARGL